MNAGWIVAAAALGALAFTRRAAGVNEVGGPCVEPRPYDPGPIPEPFRAMFQHAITAPTSALELDAYAAALEGAGYPQLAASVRQRRAWVQCREGRAAL